MIARALLLAAPLLLFLAAVSAQDRPTSQPTTQPATKGSAAPEVRGMALTLHSKDPAFDYVPLLKELPRAGVDTVCVSVHVYQPNGGSPAPARHPLKTPADAVILRVLKAARKLGLETALLPIVLLEKPGKDDWRGNLSPPDKRGRTKFQEGYGAPDWDRWFTGYERVITHYARLAEEGGVSLFSVGSELSSTEGQVARWKGLIKRIRRTFTGELTYSANWDHYEEVQHWKALDYIGLSGYYELTTSLRPTLPELTTSWTKVRDRLLAWRSKRGLTKIPLLFTELGYPSIDGCASKPWDYTRTGPVDLQEQRDCYQAFVDTWRGRPELAGVFFYEWWGTGGATDRGYTPRGKPALEVLRRWFKEPRKK